MPNPINCQELKGFKKHTEESTQNVQYGLYKNTAYYYKTLLLPNLTPDKIRLRILNEAACGKIAELLSKSLDKFITPIHALVINDDGHAVGLLSQKIEYDHFENRGTDKNNLKKVLALSGLAQISTIRYFLCDPDGPFNVGYSDQEKLSSIDYGLANFNYLLAKNTLTESEAERVAGDVFNITEENVFSGLLEPVTDIEYLVHHIFSSFKENLVGFCDSHEELVLNFFKGAYHTFLVIVNTFRQSNFSQFLYDELGINELCEEDQVMFKEIIESLMQRANQLKIILDNMRRLSPVMFEQQLAQQVDGRLSPVMLKASPQYKSAKQFQSINDALFQRAEEEEQKTNNGCLSPANGGKSRGDKTGYVTVLRPLPLSMFANKNLSNSGNEQATIQNINHRSSV